MNVPSRCVYWSFCISPIFNYFVAIYVVSIMSQMTLSLIISACLLNIYHHRSDIPPPACIRTLINGCLAPLLCIRCGKLSKCRSQNSKQQASPSSEREFPTTCLFQAHHGSTQEISLPEYVRAYLIEKAELDRNTFLSDFNKCEWQKIARVLERLSFIGFAITITFLSVMVFLKLLQ